jgi:hypothetical protein
MALKTRLDGRSEENRSFTLKNEKGETLAVVSLHDSSSVTLEIVTAEGLHIEKPNGWSSK